MKKFAILLISTLIACEVDENTPTTPVNPMNNNFDIATASLLKQGMITGQQGHTASGTASVYEDKGKFAVVLDPYSSQNGPDLKVYLSKNVGASSYINLGPLQSITGKQIYVVPGNPNIDEFTHVHIWCEKFSVEFGRAAVN